MFAALIHISRYDKYICCVVEVCERVYGVCWFVLVVYSWDNELDLF